MKRIGIDCTDAQHTQAKKQATKQNTSIANLVREFFGWPAQKQGERKDLNGKRKKSSSSMK